MKPPTGVERTSQGLHGTRSKTTVYGMEHCTLSGAPKARPISTTAGPAVTADSSLWGGESPLGTATASVSKVESYC